MTPLIIAKHLAKDGFCVCENYLEGALLKNIQNDFSEIQSLGSFNRASIGQGKDKEVQDSVRRDNIHWLDQANLNSVQSQLLAKLAELKEAFNRSLYLGIVDFEGHYAHYPAGGFYKRHIDAFRKDSSRIVSVVCYLNQNWQESDGGQLRLYTGDTYTDVEPRGGTMLCFLSQELEHEVLMSHATRSSFTGWFKTRAD
jgi:SM-20-related protein